MEFSERLSVSGSQPSNQAPEKGHQMNKEEKREDKLNVGKNVTFWRLRTTTMFLYGAFAHQKPVKVHKWELAVLMECGGLLRPSFF